MSNKPRSRMSIKQLECYIQDLKDFENPRLHLEQYATPPHIAALILNTIDLTYDDLKDKFVADLGCGTGRLTVGSLMCGAQMVLGFDIDHDALRCALTNISTTFSDDDDLTSDIRSYIYRDCERFNLIQSDLSTDDCDRFHKMFDTVLMNPPFGTKNNQGLDLLFLRRAIDFSSHAVYSLHKSSTRGFILNKCRDWNVRGKPVAQIRYNLSNTYKFHKRKSVNIDVDLWRIKCDQT